MKSQETLLIQRLAICPINIFIVHILEVPGKTMTRFLFEENREIFAITEHGILSLLDFPRSACQLRISFHDKK